MFAAWQRRLSGGDGTQLHGRGMACALPHRGFSSVVSGPVSVLRRFGVGGAVLCGVLVGGVAWGLHAITAEEDDEHLQDKLSTFRSRGQQQGSTPTLRESLAALRLHPGVTTELSAYMEGKRLAVLDATVLASEQSFVQNVRPGLPKPFSDYSHPVFPYVPVLDRSTSLFDFIDIYEQNWSHNRTTLEFDPLGRLASIKETISMAMDFLVFPMRDLITAVTPGQFPVVSRRDRARLRPTPKLLPDQLPPPYSKPNILVLDLDTLVAVPDGVDSATKRPGLEYFIGTMSQYFEIVVWSARPPIMQTAVIDRIDPSRFMISHRLFGCTVPVPGSLEKAKDVAFLNRDLNRLIMIDSEDVNVDYNYENAIKLSKWDGVSETDTALIDLIPFLLELTNTRARDVRKVLINLKSQNQDVLAAYNKARQDVMKKKERGTKSLWDKMKS